MILSGVAILLVFIALVAATTAAVQSLCTAEDAVDEEVDYPKSMQAIFSSLNSHNRGGKRRDDIGSEGKANLPRNTSMTWWPRNHKYIGGSVVDLNGYMKCILIHINLMYL